MFAKLFLPGGAIGRSFLGGVLICLAMSCGSREMDKPLPNTAAIEWNAMAYTVADQHDHFYSFIGVRALAMSALAMHDALNAIQPQFRQYAYLGQNPDADPIAALSQAAFEVLVKAYPTRKDTLRPLLEKWLAPVKPSPAKEKGIQLGKQCAAKIIAMREGDGHEKNGDYTPMTKPGDYQYTPGFDWAWKPDFSVARPFTLERLDQFRSPALPELTSPEYAASYNEVKAYGAKNSAVRSADETHIAYWWAEFAEHGWNRIGRITAAQKNLPLRETVRLFALLNVNLYDFYLVTFDSKYHYDSWRPITAIRAGDKDGNAATSPDPAWEPEMQTPPWPDYPSAHAGAASSCAEIVAGVLGTPDVAFTMVSVTANPPGTSRSYTNVDKAAEDCGRSRVLNGFHFPFAVSEGADQGRKVGRHVLSTILTPTGN